MVKPLSYFMLAMVFFILFNPILLSCSIDSLTANALKSEVFVFHGEALFLRSDFSVVYVNTSTCRCGRITYEFANDTYYSYGYGCAFPFEKPRVEIDWKYGSHLNITVYTPFFIETVIKTPIDVIVRKISENSSTVVITVTIVFRNTSFAGMIPLREIPEKINGGLINGKPYNLSDIVLKNNIIKYVVVINKKNNYGLINNTPVGFFPLYITKPVNADEIEELVSKGVIKFTEGGFVGNIFNYLGLPLLLNYGGPRQPLSLYTNTILSYRLTNGKIYHYDLYPLHRAVLDEKRGWKGPVPLSPDVARPPFNYSDKYILSRVTLRLYGGSNKLDVAPEQTTLLVNVNYLYHYPLKASLPWPLLRKDFAPFSASYVYFFDLRIDDKNLSLVSNYVVGYLDPSLMSIHEEPPWELIALMVAVVVTAGLVVVMTWRRRRYLK